MEDTNLSASTIKAIKIIIIAGIILIFIYLISSYFLRITNEKNFINYLEKENFKKLNDVWSKNEEINDKNKNTSIQTTYTRSTNSYIKEYQINADKLREQYSFKYNGDDELIIAYSSTDYANNRCLIIEEATYNRKNKNFTCKTKFNSNNCPLKCNKLKKLGADFSKELDKMFKKGNINEQFLVKNRD